MMDYYKFTYAKEDIQYFKNVHFKSKDLMRDFVQGKAVDFKNNLVIKKSKENVKEHIEQEDLLYLLSMGIQHWVISNTLTQDLKGVYPAITETLLDLPPIIEEDTGKIYNNYSLLKVHITYDAIVSGTNKFKEIQLDVDRIDKSEELFRLKGLRFPIIVSENIKSTLEKYVDKGFIFQKCITK